MQQSINRDVHRKASRSSHAQRYELVQIPRNSKTAIPINLDFNKISSCFRDAIKQLPFGIQSDSKMHLKISAGDPSISIYIPSYPYGSPEQQSVSKVVDKLTREIAEGIYENKKFLRHD